MKGETRKIRSKKSWSLIDQTLSVRKISIQSQRTNRATARACISLCRNSFLWGLQIILQGWSCGADVKTVRYCSRCTSTPWIISLITNDFVWNLSYQVERKPFLSRHSLNSHDFRYRTSFWRRKEHKFSSFPALSTQNGTDAKPCTKALFQQKLGSHVVCFSSFLSSGIFYAVSAQQACCLSIQTNPASRISRTPRISRISRILETFEVLDNKFGSL